MKKELILGCVSAMLLAACGSGNGEAGAPAPAPPTSNPPVTCGPSSRDTQQVSVGYNVNALFWEGLYRDTMMQEAVRALRSPTLRWPGGTESDYFDWSKGRPVDLCRYGGCRTWDTAVLTPPALFQRFASFSEGTPANWQRLHQAAGGRSVLVANMVTSSTTEMAGWLRMAAQSGMQVDLVELGNEPYFGQVEGTDNNARLFADAQAHVRAASALAAEVRRQFPSVKLSQPAFVPRVDVVTGQIAPGHDARMLDWNQGMLAAGATSFADAFALHFYPQLPARGSDDDAAYLDRLANFASAYWAATKATAQWRLLPADKRIWITEFNVSFAAAPALQGTWAHGLYMAQFTLQALADPRVDHVLAHMLAGNPQWQAIVHPGRVPDVQAPPPGQAYAAAPTAIGLTAIAEVVHGSVCGSPFEAAAYTAAGPFATPAGWHASSAAGEKAVFINMNSIATDVDLTRRNWREATGTAQFASPLSRVVGTAGITREPVVSTQGRMRLPPHSIVVATRTQ